MRNLKPPQLTDKEKNDIFKSLIKGNQLLQLEYNIWNGRYYAYTHTVHNITKGGGVRLDNKKLLRYLPNNWYPKDHNGANEYIKKMKLENEVLKKMDNLTRDVKLFTHNLEYEDAIALNKILDTIIDKDMEE